MSERVIMEIAGLHFSTQYRDSMVFQDTDTVYASFMQSEEDGTPADCDIVLILDDPPDIEKMTRIFDSGQSWSMFRDGDDHFIVHNPPSRPGQIAWVARCSRDFSQVTVYCGKAFKPAGEGSPRLPSPICYPLDQILMMHILAGNHGAIIHAAGVQIGGSGYIFPGKSGAGKSTLTRQFAGRPCTDLLSDDRVVVRRIGGCFKAFGTPWPGEGMVAVNATVPLAGIFFILKGSRNEIKEITSRMALERLLPVVSVPWYDRDAMKRILPFFDDLISRVPVYEMLFTPGLAAADCFEEFLSKREPRG
jgi:hypothetical protein